MCFPVFGYAYKRFHADHLCQLVRKEMYYLTTQLSHFIFLFGVGHIERKHAAVTQVVEHWMEREFAQWVHHEGSI